LQRRCNRLATSQYDPLLAVLGFIAGPEGSGGGNQLAKEDAMSSRVQSGRRVRRAFCVVALVFGLFASGLAHPGEGRADTSTGASVVTAIFNSGVLAVTGSDSEDGIIVSASTSGDLLVMTNGAAVPISHPFGPVTKDSLWVVFVSSGAGDDTVRVDANLNTTNAAGVLISPTVHISGGAGDDQLASMAGGPIAGFVGAPIAGGGVIHGGLGNDVITSSPGDDQLFGDEGNDTVRWIPGANNDIFDGGDGVDLAEIDDTELVPGASAEHVSVSSDPTSAAVSISRWVPPSYANQILARKIEHLSVLLGNGDDVTTVSDLSGGNLGTLAVVGGKGADLVDASTQADSTLELLLRGDAGNDTLRGGAGSDSVDGGLGNDRLFGNGGQDKISARDGESDAIDCGASSDLAFVDTRPPDSFVNCERIELP
jgi:Ca2+-binding RTX toxin-like protein